jgi:hypothetical protein
MPHSHRSRRLNLGRRSQLLPVDLDGEQFSIFVPRADAPISVADIGDAISLAWSALDMPVQREALVLADDDRRVTAILIDPPPTLGIIVGWSALPGLDVPFTSTLSIVIDDDDTPGPPRRIDERGYHALRRAHALQGLQLLDVILINTEQSRSLATSCDPDSVWSLPWPDGDGDDAGHTVEDTAA